MVAEPEAYRDHPNNVDPFDYATEDALAAAWADHLADLQQIAQPLADGLASMPTPQTAAGSSSS